MNNTQKRVRLYLCEAYRNGNRKERYQAIIFPSGKIKCGYDVFRLLNKVDYPSYKIYYYQHLSDFMREFELIGRGPEKNIKESLKHCFREFWITDKHTKKHSFYYREEKIS